jgi:hypothetical protein
MLRSPFTGAEEIDPQDMASQNVIVYQTESGKQIFKMDCSPIERAGQNFALSPDGLSLGVVADGAVEVYDLPPLTSKEQAAIKLAQASAPPINQLPVQLAAQTAPPSDSSSNAETQPAQPDSSSKAAPVAAPASQAETDTTNSPGKTPGPPATPPSAAAPTQDASGDAQSEESRKPPTLYTLPNDTHNQPDNQTK